MNFNECVNYTKCRHEISIIFTFRTEPPEPIFLKFSGIVYIGLERPKIIFLVMTSLPVRDINDFLVFQGVILFRDFLRNDSSYLQIFTDDRQKIEVVQDMF